MTSRVTELPQGLREDKNLENGIYVGNRHTDFIAQCSLRLKDSNHVLGSCQDAPPQSVFIDDPKGDVYVPAGKNGWFKFTKEDGIERYHTWGKRNELWNASYSVNTGAWLKYVRRGRESLTTEEIEILLRIAASVEDDLYSHVLNQHQKFEKDTELLFRAAKHWIRTGEGGSRYFPLALHVMEESIRHSKLDPGLIYDFLTLEWLLLSSENKNKFSTALIESLRTADGYRVQDLAELAYRKVDEEGKGMVLDILRQKAKDESEEPEERFIAIKSLDKVLPASDSKPREILGLILPLLENWDGEPEGFAKAGHFAFARCESLEGVEETLFDIFYERALVDPNPEYRFEAWRFMFEKYPEYKGEARGQLFAMAKNRGGIHDSLRLDIARYLAVADRDAVFKILIAMIKDKQTDSNVRLEALSEIGVGRDFGEYHVQLEEQGEKVQQALASLVPLLEGNALDKEDRHELAYFLFRDGEREDLYSKGMAYWLKEKGLKWVLNELNPKFRASDFSPEWGVQRTQWLLTQYDDSSKHDYARNSIHWTIKQIQERLPKEKLQGRGRLIVKLSQ